MPPPVWVRPACLIAFTLTACSAPRKDPQDLAAAYVAAVNSSDETAIDALFLSRATFTVAMNCGTPEALARLGDKVEEGAVKARNQAKDMARELASKPVTLVAAEMKSSEVKVANALTQDGCTNKETFTEMRMRLVVADAGGKESSERVTIVKLGDGPWYFGAW